MFVDGDNIELFREDGTMLSMQEIKEQAISIALTVYTPSDAARALKIARSSVYRYIDRQNDLKRLSDQPRSE